MKAVVVYQSRYGHTQRYAQAIACQLGCPLMTFTEAQRQDLTEFSHLIYGAPVYLGKFKGGDFLKKHLDKQLWIFAVGLSLPDSPHYEEVLKLSVAPEVQSHARFYPMHGGMNFPQLSWSHKILMFGIKKHRFDKVDLSQQDETFKQMMANYYQSFDFYEASRVKELDEKIQAEV